MYLLPVQSSVQLTCEMYRREISYPSLLTDVAVLHPLSENYTGFSLVGPADSQKLKLNLKYLNNVKLALGKSCTHSLYCS